MAPNPFRLLGDAVHFSSKLVLLYRVVTSHECKGISLRTQLLYVVLFVCRYLDLLSVFVSWYNALMKGFYIALSVVVVAVLNVKMPRQPTGLQGLDNFRIWTIMVPSALLAMLPVLTYFKQASVPAVMEYLWYYSITLEATAMIPQYVLLHRLKGDTDRLTLAYVLLQGSYRGLYIINWVIRRAMQPWYWMPYVWACGVVQFGLFCFYMFTWAAHRYLHAMPQPTLPVAPGDELEIVETGALLLEQKQRKHQETSSH